MLDPLNRAFRLTYLILWMVVFARQACLPVPANLFLLTAGVLARGGELNMLLMLVIGVLGCLAGDLVWFEAGRHWGRQIIRVLCVFSSDPHYCAQRGHSIYARWGLRSLIVAKFIPGLDGVTPPLAGIEGSSRLAFLAYDFSVRSYGRVCMPSLAIFLQVAWQSLLGRWPGSETCLSRWLVYHSRFTLLGVPG
jgi:membrane protein DedA with SNARE-associated domain